MIRITIDIDIENAEQVIRERKGFIASKLAKLLTNPKARVEREVEAQVGPKLLAKLEEALQENGIEATITLESTRR